MSEESSAFNIKSVKWSETQQRGPKPVRWLEEEKDLTKHLKPITRNSKRG
jgi:hypothetical protein